MLALLPFFAFIYRHPTTYTKMIKNEEKIWNYTSFNMIYGSINLTNLKAIFSVPFLSSQKMERKNVFLFRMLSWIRLLKANQVNPFSSLSFWSNWNPPESNRTVSKCVSKSFGFAYFIHAFLRSVAYHLRYATAPISRIGYTTFYFIPGKRAPLSLFRPI